MKFSIKVLMATLLFTLPFAFTSCGSDDDDDDNSPRTYAYSYKVESSNPDAAELLAIQAAYDTALKAVGTIEGSGSSKTLKVVAKSTTETKEQVSDRVNTAASAAHTALINQYTEWHSSRIIVTVSGNGLSFKKEYKN